jgi:hypothetical protein
MIVFSFNQALPKQECFHLILPLQLHIGSNDNGKTTIQGCQNMAPWSDIAGVDSYFTKTPAGSGGLRG